MQQFLVPLVHGFIYIRTCTINSKTFDYILLSRRSWHRAGDNQSYNIISSLIFLSLLLLSFLLLLTVSLSLSLALCPLSLFFLPLFLPLTLCPLSLSSSLSLSHLFPLFPSLSLCFFISHFLSPMSFRCKIFHERYR